MEKVFSFNVVSNSGIPVVMEVLAYPNPNKVVGGYILIDWAFSPKPNGEIDHADEVLKLFYEADYEDIEL